MVLKHCDLFAPEVVCVGTKPKALSLVHAPGTPKVLICYCTDMTNLIIIIAGKNAVIPVHDSYRLLQK